MNLRLAWVVLHKELLDGLRDRRALVSALVFPLLGPALIALMMGVIAQDEDTRGSLEMTLVGAEHAPSLVGFLESGGATIIPPPDDPDAAVRSGDLPFVVVVDDFVDTCVLRVLPRWRWSSIAPGITPGDVSENASSGMGLSDRSAAAHRPKLDPALVQPLQVEEVDLATPEQRAANLLEMVVMFIITSHSSAACTWQWMRRREARAQEPRTSSRFPSRVGTRGRQVHPRDDLRAARCASHDRHGGRDREQRASRTPGAGATPAHRPRAAARDPAACPRGSFATAIGAATSIKEAQTWLSMTPSSP